MPPKAGGKKSKKGKKGKKKGVDEDEKFQEYLDETFFLPPQARLALKDRCLREVRDVFTIFQGDRDGLCDARELGAIVRHLGFNPTNTQLKLILPLVDDGESGTFIVYEKLAPVLSELMLSKELKYTVTLADGTVEHKTTLIHREPERVVMNAFDSVWDSSGRKLDHDRSRYLDAEPLRELLVRHGPEDERFDDTEATEFLHAAADPENGFVKEDLFALLSLE